MAQYNLSGKKRPKMFAGNINYIFINIRIILIRLKYTANLRHSKLVRSSAFKDKKKFDSWGSSVFSFLAEEPSKFFLVMIRTTSYFPQFQPNDKPLPLTRKLLFWNAN